MLNYELFVKNMTVLAEVYEKQLTKPLIAIYYEVVKEMTDSEFKTAIRSILSDRVYPSFPKPAEIFAHKQEVITDAPDTVTLEAKRLIELVHNMNYQVFDDSTKMGVPFLDLLDKAKFPSLSEEDNAILNQVKPHCSLKLLIGNINTYDTTQKQLESFKNAIRQNDKIGFIENAEIKKRIGK